MSKLSKWVRGRAAKRRGYHGVNPEVLWRQLIVKYARGHSLIDVGCLWRVNGDYAFLAADSGATSVTGLDIEPATPEFLARNAARSNPITFVQGDLNDPMTMTRTGMFDVVFCSGVLYHVPNPVLTLEQLRRLCRERLILTTASMPERRPPNLALLLPGMDDASREALRFATPRGNRKVGLDTRFDPKAGYGNWVWLPTPSCVRAMVTLAGFSIEAFYPTRRMTTVVAKPGRAASWEPSTSRAPSVP